VFENGTRVVGESKIFSFKKEQDCRISHVSLIPERPKALPAALEAIGQADIILLGPGSLYTSIIPNLLVDGIVDAICKDTPVVDRNGSVAAENQPVITAIRLIEKP
jgi:uncharacterized cofD-like protein